MHVFECSWPLEVGVVSNCIMGLFWEQISPSFLVKAVVPKQPHSSFRHNIDPVSLKGQGAHSKNPHFQNEGRCKAFLVIMVSFA